MKRVAAFILAIILLAPGSNIMASNEEIKQIPQSNNPSTIIYQSSKEYMNDKITLGNNVKDANRNKIFTHYMMYLNGASDIESFISSEGSLVELSEAYSDRIIITKVGGDPLSSVGILSSDNDGYKVNVSAKSLDYENTFVNPNRSSINAKMIEKGYNGLQFTTFTNLDVTGFIMSTGTLIDGKYTPNNSSDWDIYITKHSQVLELKAMTIYTRTDFIEKLTSYYNAKINPELWQGVSESYYKITNTYNNRVFTYNYSKTEEYDYKFEGLIEPKLFTEIYTIKYPGGSRESIKKYWENYSEGDLAKSLISTGEIATCIDTLDVNNGKIGTYRMGADAVFNKTDNRTVPIKDIYTWEDVNLVTRIDNNIMNTLDENVILYLVNGGFEPTKTKAVAFKIPNYTEMGILFYDGVHEAFYNGEYVGYADKNVYYSAQDLKCNFLDNINHLVEDENGNKDEYTNDNPSTAKPVIYLYPEKTTDISVTLTFDGKFTYTYPTIINNTWEVTAHSDGRLINKTDDSEHYYLFWEGVSPHDWDISTGFVVKGEDTEKFLREKLAYIGLTPREYNDFIVYWVPILQENNYNLIHFSELKEYEKVAALEVSPTPDSVLRVHMAWKALDSYIEMDEQKLATFKREGFTVVEWGGTQVR